MKYILLIIIVYLGWSSSYAGQNHWTNIGPESGTVTTVALVEGSTVDNKFYLGTNGAGVFTMQTFASNWIPLRDGLAGVRIWDLEISPEFSTNSTIFLASESGGLQRSTDAGGTWSLIEDEVLRPSVQVRAIEFIQETGGLIGFVGARSGGVFRTTDGGSSWQEVSAGIAIPLIESIVVSPDYLLDHTVFVGTIGSGVYRSTDAGLTWQEQNTGMGSIVVHCLAVWPGTTVDRTVLAGTENGLFKSLDNGENWLPILVGSGHDAVRCLARPGRLTTSGAVFAGVDKGGLFHSMDWGTSWAPIPGTEGLTPLSVVVEDPSIYAGFGLAGIEGHGVLGSNDGGITWEWLNSGLHAVDINAVRRPGALNPPEILAVAANTGIYLTTDGGGSWRSGLFQCPSSMVSDLELSPTILSDGLALAAIPGCGVFRSTDSAASFEQTTAGLTNPDVMAIGLLPDFPTNPIVYSLTAGSGFFLSTDAGLTWMQRNNGLEPQDLVLLSEDVIYWDGATPTIIIGSDTGGLYRSDDLGGTWSYLLRIPQARRIRSVELGISPSGELIGFIGTDGYGVYRSLDGGTTWVQVNEGLPSLRATQVCYLNFPGGTPLLVVATEDAGIYTSLNLGDTWEDLNIGLGTLDTKAFTAVIDVSGELILYTGTWGGSTWRYTVENPQVDAKSPGPRALRVAADSPATVTFSKSMNPASVQFHLLPEVPVEVAWAEGNTIATLNHEGFMRGPLTYCCEVAAGSDTLGRALGASAQDHVWCFTVDEPPIIMVAGFWSSEPDTQAGGPVTMLAYTTDEDIQSIQLGYEGQPLGLHLWDDGTAGDWCANDGLYTYFLPELGAGAAAGAYGLDLIAFDVGGQTSVAWPGLRVEQPWSAWYQPPPSWRSYWRQARSVTAPKILLGGFWDTSLNKRNQIGSLTMLAYVTDPDGTGDIESVELYYQGLATGVLLNDAGTQGDWTAGDGLFTLAVSVTEAVPEARYAFELVAQDRAGEASDAWPYLVVKANPLIVDFTLSQQFGYAPLTVQFQAYADAGVPPYEYIWDLGDGSTAFNQQVTHTYEYPGNYQVTVLARDATAASDQAQHSIVVSVNAALSAAISCSNLQVQAPDTITLTGTAQGGAQPYVRYLWEIDDGRVLEGKAVEAEFTEPGDFTVTLEVTDSYGAYAQAHQALQIYSTTPPQAHIIAEPSEGEPPLTVRFSAEAEGGAEPYTYTWNFRGAMEDFVSEAEGATVSFTFSQGVHDVILRVVDYYGAITMTSLTVTVENQEDCSHILSTSCSIEVEEQRAVVFRSELQDIQPGDRVVCTLVKTGETQPCATVERFFTAHYERVSIAVKFLDDNQGCYLPSGQTGTIGITFNESACPDSTKVFVIP